MSVNLSLIRNIDSTCRNSEGKRFDFVLIGEKEDKKGTFVVEIPHIFNNDYELLYALKNGLSVIEHQPIVKANTAELGATFEIDEKKAEALRKSHYMCSFVDSSYFYITGNMLRFSIDKKQGFVKFIKDRELMEAYSYEGSIIPCLPDLFIKANLAKQKRDLYFYEKELKVGQKCEMIKEKRKVIAELEALIGNTPDDVDTFVS